MLTTPHHLQTNESKPRYSNAIRHNALTLIERKILCSRDGNKYETAHVATAVQDVEA